MFIKKIIRNGSRIVTYHVFKKTPSHSQPKLFSFWKFVAIPSSLIVFGTYTWSEYKKKVNEKQMIETKNVSSKHKGKCRLRKTHFESFASVNVVGQAYMTTRDFIDCIFYESPRPRINRKVIVHLKNYLKIMPGPGPGSQGGHLGL